MRKRRIIFYAAIGLLILLLVAGIAADQYVRSLGPRTRARVIQALADRFDADVELHSLNIYLLPLPTVTGDGLFIRHRNYPPDHPLIAIAHFSASAKFEDLLWQRDRVNRVRLQGLQIHIPPQGASAFSSAMVDSHQVASGTPGQDTTQLRIHIGEIDADGAFLEIEPKTAGKLPRQFRMQRLVLYSVGPAKPFRFITKLENPKPPGIIDTMGYFGPWQKDDPRATAVNGTYAFSHANLAVFSGISGILSSSGKYSGVLQKIEVYGTTDTPNFALKRGGTAVDLKTRFHSIVNGMDGETVLYPVNAHFLHSDFVCTGGVVREDDDLAKTVDLYAVAKQARIEDILRLILGDQGGPPIVRGPVEFRSKIVIPPGQADVISRLRLDGQFRLPAAYFGSAQTERRLLTLSDRARGITKEDEQNLQRHLVAADLKGDFRLDGGDVTFRSLSFGVPGAQIKLAGSYNLENQNIDMSGIFRMNATLAETQSGVKRLLLKPLDRFFAKDGAGFEVPLGIGGDRQHPDLSVEVFHHRFTMK